MTHSSKTDLAFTRSGPFGEGSEPSYSGALSFMRRLYSKDVADADLAVFGVPYDLATTNRPGSRFGPRAIRAASSMISSSAFPYGWDFDPFERLKVVDYGDCKFDFGVPQKAPEEIEHEAREILSKGTGMLSFGGDHFVTYPLLKAHAAIHGPMSLVHFDAHTDTWPDPENKRIDHGTMFYHAARENLIDPASSVQIGIRTENKDTMGFNIIDAPALNRIGVETTCARIREIVSERPVYLTFDIDCLDPAYAPGTGTPVCGGLSTREALDLLNGLAGLNIVGMDVVEVAPAYDVGEVTALAAATIALQLICLFATRGDGS